ncbi:hypothetical protein ABK040_003558 [Willaertia magna]
MKRTIDQAAVEERVVEEEEEILTEEDNVAEEDEEEQVVEGEEEQNGELFSTPTKSPSKKKVKREVFDFSKYAEGDIVEGLDGKYKITLIQDKLCKVPVDRPVRIYADGIYDVFHFGHMRSLQQAKNLFPSTQLIVGVCNDELTNRMKGKTVLTEQERYESVSHCRYVDEVVPDAPWIVTPDFVEKHNIDFVTHGEDPCVDEFGNDVYAELKNQHKFLTIKRTEGISTSDIIMRIIKERDAYVERNLKRGYTADQLGVGLIERTSHMLKKGFESVVNVFSPRKKQQQQSLLDTSVVSVTTEEQ